VLKRPILSCPLAPSRVARTCQTRRHSPRRVARTRQTRQHSPNHLPSTRQTRRHSPNAIFEKNVTRLATFARVIRHSREFGASGHCLVLLRNFFISLTERTHCCLFASKFIQLTRTQTNFLMFH
jgi:hypothetical protein